MSSFEFINLILDRMIISGQERPEAFWKLTEKALLSGVQDADADVRDSAYSAVARCDTLHSDLCERVLKKLSRAQMKKYDTIKENVQKLIASADFGKQSDDPFILVKNEDNETDDSNANADAEKKTESNSKADNSSSDLSEPDKTPKKTNGNNATASTPAAKKPAATPSTTTAAKPIATTPQPKTAPKTEVKPKTPQPEKAASKSTPSSANGSASDIKKANKSSGGLTPRNSNNPKNGKEKEKEKPAESHTKVSSNPKVPVDASLAKKRKSLTQDAPEIKDTAKSLAFKENNKKHRELIIAGSEILWNAFNTVDTDFDSMISLAEFESAMTSLNISFTPEASKAAFQA
ncbi:hypothetical protein RFI_10543, partial [Reticulomyxa filosa]